MKGEIPMLEKYIFWKILVNIIGYLTSKEGFKGL